MTSIWKGGSIYNYENVSVYCQCFKGNPNGPRRMVSIPNNERTHQHFGDMAVYLMKKEEKIRRLWVPLVELQLRSRSCFLPEHYQTGAQNSS